MYDPRAYSTARERYDTRSNENLSELCVPRPYTQRRTPSTLEQGSNGYHVASHANLLYEQDLFDEDLYEFDDTARYDNTLATRARTRDLHVPPHIHRITPLPEQQYASYEKAMAALRAWALASGVDLVVLTTRVHEQLLGCDRHGSLQNNHKLSPYERKRDRASKKIGCKMRVKIVMKESRFWVRHTRDGSTLHNHRPSRDPRIHTGHRQRAAAASTLTPQASSLDWILAQSSVGVPAASIEAGLCITDSMTLVTRKDIANAKGKARQRLLATRTSMEALFDIMDENGFIYFYAADTATAELRYVFWAHKQMLHLYAQWPGVVILDCTYKTNRHDMPLLNMVAVSGLNKVIPVAHCWLYGEAEPDFVWALRGLRRLQELYSIPSPSVFVSDRALACLNALKTVYGTVPTVLCQWHVRNNVLARTRKVFPQIRNPPGSMPLFSDCAEAVAFMNKFRETVNSETVTSFEHNRAGLRVMSEELANYLDRNWWPYKEMLVRFWTDAYHHRGCLDTSIVEGTHATMKRWLPNSRADLLGAFQALLPWWITRSRKLSLCVEYNATMAPYKLQAPFFAAVVRVITVWALYETHALVEKAQEVLAGGARRTSCKGSFRRVHGRPCVHELLQILESRGRLRLRPAQYDSHWWVQPRDAHSHLSTRVLEPNCDRQRATTRTPLSHGSNMGMHRTRRDFLWSERVDQNHPSRPLHCQGRVGYQDADLLQYEEVSRPARVYGYAGRS
jgi:hypothetical protein